MQDGLHDADVVRARFGQGRRAVARNGVGTVRRRRKRRGNVLRLAVQSGSNVLRHSLQAFDRCQQPFAGVDVHVCLHFAGARRGQHQHELFLPRLFHLFHHKFSGLQFIHKTLPFAVQQDGTDTP